MKKAILVLLVIGLLCVGHIFADNNGPWSVGVQFSVLAGITVTGGYDTLHVGVGVNPWYDTEAQFGFGANWFYPFEIAETVKLGPGIALIGMTKNNKVIFALSPIVGVEYNFAGNFVLAAQIGYPALAYNNEFFGLFNTAPLINSFALGVKYRF